MGNRNINKWVAYLNLDNVLEYDYTNKKVNILNKILYMLNRSNIMFRYHGLPDTISMRDLESLLQGNGFCLIGKINGTLYAVNGGLGGECDVYNHPTIATVSVPYLNFNANWNIGTDCVLLQNDTNAIGLLPMYAMYCTQLAESDISLMMNCINKRVQSVISANDDNTYQSAIKYLNDLENGKLGVISESKFMDLDTFKVSPVASGQTTNIKDLIEYHQYVKASMYNDIGLNANWNAKRERLTKGEIEMNSDNLYPLVDDMLENRRSGVDKINELFGTDITVELNSSWDYRLYNGESIHNTESEMNANNIVESVDNDQQGNDNATNDSVDDSADVSDLEGLDSDNNRTENETKADSDNNNDDDNTRTDS